MSLSPHTASSLREDDERQPPECAIGLVLGAYSFDTRGSVGRYTGADGPQQSAEEVIFTLPNGL